jgi:protein-disulfide isomerase
MMFGQQTATLVVPVSRRDHVKGSLDAPVVLVEYGDYECPYCREAHFYMQRVEPMLGDLHCFAFRNFPLTTVHPHAEQAAKAAEAAGAQGKFWEMHDTLFENQDALDDLSLLAYARHIGLDIDRFGLDMVEHVHARRVREDFLSGVKSGVNGTPTFFINGVRHDGGYDTLLEAIESVAAVRVR